MLVHSEKIAKKRASEFKKKKKTNKDIDNFCPGSQEPGEMHSQKISELCVP